MKWTLAFSILQTCLLIAIIVLVHQGSRYSGGSVSQVELPASPHIMPSKKSIVAGATSLSAGELREIIKQEIGLAFEQARNESRVQLTSEPRTARQRLAPAPGLRAELEAQIIYFESVGEIGSQEMEKLQLGLARLPAAERKALLSRLARSLSNGTIDGRF